MAQLISLLFRMLNSVILKIFIVEISILSDRFHVPQTKIGLQLAEVRESSYTIIKIQGIVVYLKT